MRIVALICLLLFASCKAKKETASSEPKHKRNKILVGVTVTSIRVLEFPKYAKDGEKWDAYAPFATDPDLFLNILWNETLLYKSETLNECVFGTVYSFTNNLPLQVKPFDQPLTFELFDEDGVSSNDNMSYCSVKLLDYQDKQTFVVSCADTKLEITATWFYQ